MKTIHHLVGLALALNSLIASAASMELPLHVNVDGSYVKTAAKLVLPMATGDATPVAARMAFARLTTAIGSRDLRAAQRLLELAPPADGDTNRDLATRTTALVDSFNGAFSGMKSVQLVGSVPTDHGLLLLWQDTSRKSLLRGFIYRSEADRRPPFLQVSSQGTPVESFIVNAVDKALAAGEAPSSAASAAAAATDRLALTSSGAYLQFLPSPTQVEALLGPRAAHRLAGKVQSTQDVFDLSTPESRNKLIAWYRTLPEASQAELLALWSTDRKSLRVFNASPVFIAAHEQVPDVSVHHAGAYSYEYYVQQPGKGTLLSNVFRESLLDDALKPALAQAMAATSKK